MLQGFSCNSISKLNKMLRDKFIRVKRFKFQRNFFLTTLYNVIKKLEFVENIKLANLMEKQENIYEYEDDVPEKRTFFERPEGQYFGNVPLFKIEKIMLFVFSSLGSYYFPNLNQNIVALGEVSTSKFFLMKLKEDMLADANGRKILQERPSITSKNINLEKLSQYPKNELGYVYYQWLQKEKVSPDTRVKVRFIDDEELAYIFQRYRESHDFHHAITNLPTNIYGEIVLKIIEFANIGIPFAGFGAFFAIIRLKKVQFFKLTQNYFPWLRKNLFFNKKLMNIYWEKLLHKDITELRKEIGINFPFENFKLR